MKRFTINGAVVQAYPLTAAQRVHYYTVMACQRHELLNIGTGFYLEYPDANIDSLKECIKEGYQKFESMRLRLTVDKKGAYWQYLVPTDDRDIPVVDFSFWKEEDAHNEMKRWTTIPMMPDGGPLNEIKIIKLPGGYVGMYMKVHHMTMDSSAIIQFYSYVLNLYCHKNFENVPAPREPRSYLEQLQKDLAYDAGSPQMLKDQAYWEETLKAPEPLFSTFSARDRLQELRDKMGNQELRSCFVSGDITADIRIYDLEGEPSERLAQFCRENRVPMAVLLMLGLRTVFSRFAGGQTDISVKNAVARRGSLNEQLSGGTRIHFWPLRTDIAPETTFREALAIVQAKENSLLRHANYDPIRHMGHINEVYGSPMGSSYECTTLTYQPMSLAGTSQELPKINYKSRWYSNGVALQFMYVTVMHRPTDNGLSFNFEYQKNEVTEDEIEKLYYYLMRAIFLGVEDPNRTIGEILEWM